MGDKPILGTEDIQRILAFRKQGLSWERIAEEMFVGRRTIFTAMKRYRNENPNNK